MRTTTTLIAAAACTASAHAQQPFSIIALPDTQNYVNSTANTPLFGQQTQWIADQILVDGNPRDIVFVSHLGDLVSTGTNITQWDRADAAMGNLDAGPGGVVPYGVLPGNHDFATTGSKSTGTDNYETYFGADRFANAAWFGGTDPSGSNSYQFFTGDGTHYLHIALEWRPDQNVTNEPTRDPSPLAWAQSIISENPGLPTIISSHEHLDDDPAGRSPLRRERVERPHQEERPDHHGPQRPLPLGRWDERRRVLPGQSERLRQRRRAGTAGLSRLPQRRRRLAPHHHLRSDRR